MNNLLRQRKEAIAVLGGVIRKKKDGTWRTSSLYEKGESFGSLGDGLRVKAAALMYQQNPNYLIVVSGGYGRFKKIAGISTLVQVIKDELLHLKVPKRAIIIEDKSNSTYEQLQEIKKIINKNNITDLILISNDWHLPRVRTMIKLDWELKKMVKKRHLKLKSAEKILINEKPLLWRKKIEKFYNQNKMKLIIQLEKKGVKNLLEGKYIFRKTV